MIRSKYTMKCRNTIWLLDIALWYWMIIHLGHVNALVRYFWDLEFYTYRKNNPITPHLLYILNLLILNFWVFLLCKITKHVVNSTPISSLGICTTNSVLEMCKNHAKISCTSKCIYTLKIFSSMKMIDMLSIINRYYLVMKLGFKMRSKWFE